MALKVKLTTAALNSALSALGLDQSSASNSGWATTDCPACAVDGRPSLRVNVTTGDYRCYRCGASSAGDEGVPLDVFLGNPVSPGLSVARTRDLPPLTEDLVARYHRLLMDSPAVVADLERKRGWTEATITQLQIGWDGSHLWIPIRDVAGGLMNARMYDPFRRTNIKSFHYANEEGTRRTVVWAPFGVKAFEGSDTIWLFEGEPDGILAAQLGFPTALITGGAGTWIDEILSVVKDRRVVLCYDMDTAGRRGGRAIRARLMSHGTETLHLEFPLSDPTYKDFSDAIIKDKRDRKYFRQLAKDQWEGIKLTSPELPPIPVKLGGGVPKEPITVKAHVLGTNTVPVLVPQLVEARCQMNWDEKKCQGCPCFKAQGMLRMEVDPESEQLMVLAVTPTKIQHLEFKRMAGINPRCPMVKWSVPGHWQIQHVKLIPPMSERHGGDSTYRAGMFVSPADGRQPPIKANQLYHFQGKVEPDILSNEWTLLSSDAMPAEDDIDAFRMDVRLVEDFTEHFRPREWTAEAIHQILLEEERSLSRHITKVYGREQLLRLVDLCYHSVLRFTFRGTLLQRGWLALVIIGDTRTGKSETMSAMSKYFGLGKYIMDPANTTYAGLVGGLQQVGQSDKSWVVTWGLIPTNDRGLVVVDEVSSMSLDDIGKMSGMRSSGIAEITKIRNSSTPARTRLIMAGNPRGHGKMLDSYGTPVEGIVDLIGAPEDIARFDMAMAVKQGLDKDVADRALGDQPHPVMIDLRRALVRFAWSRAEHQIEWEDGAEQLAVEIGTKMAKDYDHHIPLVEPSEQDIKVARVAVAAACRTFSVTPTDPNILFVRKCHVLFAERVLRDSFDGDLGYGDFSAYQRRHVLNEDAIKTAIVQVQPRTVASTCRALLGLRRVNPNSIGMVLALDGGEARQFLATMAQNGAAIFDQENSRNTAMVWTPDMMALLRTWEKNPPKTEGEDLF